MVSTCIHIDALPPARLKHPTDTKPSLISIMARLWWAKDASRLIKGLVISHSCASCLPAVGSKFEGPSIYRSRWSKIIQYGPQWLKLAQDVSSWLKLHDGSIWLKFPQLALSWVKAKCGSSLPNLAQQSPMSFKCLNLGP